MSEDTDNRDQRADGLSISVNQLTKQFGQVKAVDNLSFTVKPGRVTGFLGPNGAGKTTTLRILLGLVQATSGTALFGGKPYTTLEHPATRIGAALEASSFHPGRTALDHLKLYAQSAGATTDRCTELLEFLGLGPAADRRVGGFSTGMRQRLGLATALLGDPEVLILDEPTNGLDPEGIAWLRNFLKDFAAAGRTVLVSSHVLSEVQQSVDDVVIIARGQLVHESPLVELNALAVPAVIVDGPQPTALADLVEQQQWTAQSVGAHGGALRIQGVRAAEVGAAAFANRIELHRLEEDAPSLEEVFLRLVAEGAPAPAMTGAAA
ncbi:ABC-2 type transport system ATP-binding protein [Micrococcales bacterium KH10]|nr:ABC-2 type transport system ATP-binding protein [Micrococcales bacterium KH10]